MTPGPRPPRPPRRRRPRTPDPRRSPGSYPGRGCCVSQSLLRAAPRLAGGSGRTCLLRRAGLARRSTIRRTVRRREVALGIHGKRPGAALRHHRVPRRRYRGRRYGRGASRYERRDDPRVDGDNVIVAFAGVPVGVPVGVTVDRAGVGVASEGHASLHPHGKEVVSIPAARPGPGAAGRPGHRPPPGCRESGHANWPQPRERLACRWRAASGIPRAWRCPGRRRCTCSRRACSLLRAGPRAGAWW
jgi:hypothetical protein